MTDDPSRRSVLGLLGAAPLMASTGREPAAAGRSLEAYDDYIRDLADQDRFSGTVLVAHRGRVVLSRAYGMADRERKIPNGPDTIYALASASKPFTGLAIVQLAQQGRLRFHEKLSTYLDGFPPDVGAVTVHQMLTHTGGMTDPTNSAGGGDKILNSIEEAEAEGRKQAREQKLRFVPGTRKEYASMGYNVLGEIVAAVSGMPFHEYMREHVFQPAGMRRSAYYTRPQWLDDERIAHPYMLQEDGSRIDGVRNLDKGGTIGVKGSNSARGFIGAGGGNAFASASDLLRFAWALKNHKLLNRAYTEMWLSPKISGPSPGVPDPRRGESFHAYGPIAPIFNNQRLITHGGGIAGGSTNWSVYLDTEWTAVVLCNYDLRDLQQIIEQEREAIAG
ncbi:serine hydrolase domain-containing protein [Nonomuraea sp. NPDC050547]|uniref:serine hydrolase domain-containing protein n=1 Tax=Nonomuraea sp. NPDC050547 TaxID=3364368 RepID=UPI0037B13FE7